MTCQQSTLRETSVDTHRLSPLPLGILLTVWLTIILGSVAALGRYESTPGASADPPQNWPAESAFSRNPSGPTLLMFIHPQCPCTRASLSQLERVLGASPASPHVLLVFVRPPGLPDAWATSGLWDRARANHNWSLLVDKDGRESLRFRVRTSGQVLLYDTTGQLRYSGGLTVSRGQEGNSSSQLALLAKLGEPGENRASQPVYGCPLLNSGPGCRTKGTPCRLP